MEEEDQVILCFELIMLFPSVGMKLAKKILGEFLQKHHSNTTPEILAV